jgi:hypothetical protein
VCVCVFVKSLADWNYINIDDRGHTPKLKRLGLIFRMYFYQHRRENHVMIMDRGIASYNNKHFSSRCYPLATPINA